LAPLPGVRLPSGFRKNQSNDFPEHYLHFGRSKVIILGAARQGITLNRKKLGAIYAPGVIARNGTSVRGFPLEILSGAMEGRG
jgi:hypothetical protein